MPTVYLSIVGCMVRYSLNDIKKLILCEEKVGIMMALISCTILVEKYLMHRRVLYSTILYILSYEFKNIMFS